MSRKKVSLVAGAGGMIGGHLVKRLLDRDEDVIAVDRKPEKDWYQLHKSATNLSRMDLNEQSSAWLVFRSFPKINDVWMLACFDDQSEVWTNSGWKRFEDLNGSEEIATLSAEGFLEWQRPTGYLSYEYSGDMYHWSTQTTDLMVTPNHNVRIRRPHRSDYELRRADQSKLKQIRMQRGMKWDGEQLETFHIDVNVDNLHGNANKAMDFPVVPFVRFLGYYLSEGSLKVKSNGTYEVHLSNSSPTILSDMMQCVRDLGYNPYFDASSSHGISFSSRVMVEYLSKFGLSGDKYIPREVKDLSPDILAHLFETLNHGDGARDRNTYYTTSPTLADDFGELCVKLGKSYTVSRGDIRNPNWAPLYSVYYCDKQETVLHEYPDVETYQGMVYCVEVPNHVIYVRRNGKASWVGNCDMGGIGFIEGNKLQCMLSVQMSTNMLRFAAENYVDRYFYSSSACAYPVHLQTDAGDVTALSEDMAYPANSEDGYGWEKLFTERMCRHFMEETGMETHVARYHNIYGTETSWNDGREKAPAAIARKVAEAVVYGYNHINIWGDGSQARSFCWINDCIDGSLQLMDSSIYAPVNIGSDRLITVNELVTMVEGFAEVELERRYNLDAPKGVAGRNSDNTFVRENLGWEPKIALEDGMKELYFWILEKVQHNKLNGIGPVVNEY